MRVGPKPTNMIRVIIRNNQEEYTAQRPTYSTGPMGQTQESEAPVTYDMWIHTPMVMNLQNEYGERLDGDLLALALPSADVQTNDVITHGTNDYEVQEVVQLPNDQNVDYKVVSLDKRIN